MGEDNNASDDHGPVIDLNGVLLQQADHEEIPKHLRVMARRLELALARQINLPCDD